MPAWGKLVLCDLGDILSFLTGHALYGSHKGIYDLAEYFLGRSVAKAELKGVALAIRSAVEVIHPELPTTHDYFNADTPSDVKEACHWWAKKLGTKFDLSPKLKGCIALDSETGRYHVRWMEPSRPLILLYRVNGVDVELIG